MVKENESIAFTEHFAFEDKDTTNFLNKTKEKIDNLYVFNISLDPKLLEWVKNSLKQELPFLIHKGNVTKIE